MKKRWIIIALVLSLAMNAGILGMLIVKWLTNDKSPERTQTIGPFGLDDLQSKQAQELRRQFLESRQKNRAKLQESQEARRAFMSTLTDQNFDETKARRQLKEYLATRAETEKAIGESLISLRSGIKDPQTLETFSNRVRQRNDQLDELARRDTVRADSLHRARNPVRARILNKLRQRRANWQNRLNGQ